MRKRTRMMLGTIVATIAMAGLAGSAYGSGNGNGNGANANGNGAANGNSPAAGGQAAAATASPGNSADAPGQAAKPEHGNPGSGNPAHAPAATPQHQESAAPGKGGGHGPSRTSTHGNSTNTAASPGLKPTNSTSSNFSAPASSTSTKRYGNGKTAGQIAIHYGAPGSTMLYGPGNSQPHKISGCAHPLHGKGGGIDVHALKADGRQFACASQQPTAAGVGVISAFRRATGSDPAVGAVTPAAKPSGSSTAESKPAPRAQGESDSDVLTAFGTPGEGSLPFTGISLWAVALLGLAFAVFGLTLRRQARADA